MSKPYCGYKSIAPKGQRLGTFEECMKKGQIRRYGMIAVTPEQLKKLVENVKNITKDMPKTEVKKAIKEAQKQITQKEEKQLEKNLFILPKKSKPDKELMDDFLIQLKDCKNSKPSKDALLLARNIAQNMTVEKLTPNEILSITTDPKLLQKIDLWSHKPMGFWGLRPAMAARFFRHNANPGVLDSYDRNKYFNPKLKKLVKDNYQDYSKEIRRAVIEKNKKEKEEEMAKERLEWKDRHKGTVITDF